MPTSSMNRLGIANRCPRLCKDHASCSNSARTKFITKLPAAAEGEIIVAFIEAFVPVNYRCSAVVTVPKKTYDLDT